MHDSAGIPQAPPAPVLALFRDSQGARTAIETMLQGGFLGEQLALMEVEASVPSAANDMTTYRASGIEGPNQKPAESVKHGVIVSVQATAGQEGNAREMLAALGGRLLRPDGTFESEAA